jgi:hypothetical protein
MNPRQHLERADIVIAGMRKLAMPDDYLALVDSTMVAGYHLGNALLHAHGVLADADHSNTPSKLEAPIATLPAAIRPALEAFAALEKLRFDFVRSASVYDPRLDREVWLHLDTMREACRKI